jgi:hopanoid C-2 methylase
VLLVYPRFTPNQLLNYEKMTPFYPGKRALMPPLGLLLFGAKLVERFDVRMVDENDRMLTSADLEWAEVVTISAMHPQRGRVLEIVEEARELDKLTVLGGPSVSICPELYPSVDVLHVGEMGDATELLIERLAETADRPPEQLVFRTENATPLDEQPMPALELIDVNKYLMQPIQFSLGCPFTCEFCDIPMIYGRVARIKSAARVLRELDAIYASGFIGTILFVDDNLVANSKALLAFLPQVIEWQERYGMPYALTGEASLDIAKKPEVLELLRKARFTHLFIGIESPDPGTLKIISKRQNVFASMVESVQLIESMGIEVIIGMILGFDSDTPKSGEALSRFVADTNVPIVYFNLLAALPKTPLWDRMNAAGRLIDEDGDTLQSQRMLSGLHTNIRYKLPNEVVRAMLIEAALEVYSPERLYERQTHNARHVYIKQRGGRPPSATFEQKMKLARVALGTITSVLWEIGVKADYRAIFWRFAWEVARLRISGGLPSALDVIMRVGPGSHHLIHWARDIADQAAVEFPAAQILPRKSSRVTDLV